MRCLLRDRRRAQGVSQRDLERISGIARANISAYENNRVVMTIETAAKFALILHCTLDDLFEIKRN
ncbi:helix-turn-helix transcriptional regulator [Sporosarcina sp. E16_3]|nr:helix-turn-helix transcriptional regulator [Sporosarcina sp. E16_3]